MVGVMLSVVVSISKTSQSVDQLTIDNLAGTGTRPGPSSGTGTRPGSRAAVPVGFTWILHSYVRCLTLQTKKEHHQ